MTFVIGDQVVLKDTAHGYPTLSVCLKANVVYTVIEYRAFQVIPGLEVPQIQLKVTREDCSWLIWVWAGWFQLYQQNSVFSLGEINE